jgi:hypothetical protein
MTNDEIVEVLLAVQRSLDARLIMIETLKTPPSAEAEVRWNLGYAAATQDLCQIFMVALDGRIGEVMERIAYQERDLKEYTGTIL